MISEDSTICLISCRRRAPTCSPSPRPAGPAWPARTASLPDCACRTCQRQQHMVSLAATEGSARNVVAGGPDLWAGKTDGFYACGRGLPHHQLTTSSPPVRAQHRCVAAALPRRCANFAPPSRRCHSLALLPSPPPRPLRIDAFSHCLSLKRSHRDAANRLHGSAHPGPGSSSRARQYIVVVAPAARPASPGRRSGSSRPPRERS